MTYVAILRTASASDRELVRLERQILARMAKDCPAAKWVASSGSSGHSECLDLFEAPDERTAAEIVAIARVAGLTEPAICSSIPWGLFAKQPVDWEC